MKLLRLRTGTVEPPSRMLCSKGENNWPAACLVRRATPTERVLCSPPRWPCAVSTRSSISRSGDLRRDTATTSLAAQTCPACPSAWALQHAARARTADMPGGSWPHSQPATQSLGLYLYNLWLCPRLFISFSSSSGRADGCRYSGVGRGSREGGGPRDRETITRR